MKKFFGDRKFYKTILLLAIPIMLQQFITAFVSLIDNVMIGSVGNIALTAVTVANKPIIIFQSLMFGVSGAAGIFIAQFYGAKNFEKTQESFNINVLLALLVGVLFTVIFFICPKEVVSLFTTTPAINSLAVDYIKVIRFAFIPYAISLTCMMSLRNVGIVKVQLGASTTAVIINTLLNYCLIFGHFGFPKMGVPGAAIATLIARLIETLLYILILKFKHYFITIDFKGIFRPKFRLMKSILIKGYPVIGNEIFWSLGTSLVFLSYMRCDEYMVAAISVVDTVSNMMFIIFGGLSSAVAIQIGTKLGAGKLQEAKDNSYKLIAFAVMMTMVIGGIVAIAAPYIPNIYNLEPELNKAIVYCLRIKSVSIIPIGVNLTIFFTLRAGGDTKNTFLLDSGFLWGGSVLISTLLSMFTDISIVQLFLAIEVLEFVKFFLALIPYRQGKWISSLVHN